MPWRLIAKAFGWRTATDEDGETPLLVVWHPHLRRHFTGPDAWRRAVRVTIARASEDPDACWQASRARTVCRDLPGFGGGWAFAVTPSVCAAV